MLGIINERQLSEEQLDKLELEELAPDKFDPEIQFKVNKQLSDVYSEVRFRPLTREETAKLMTASKAKVVLERVEDIRQYGTYSREQIEAFMTEHYAYKHKPSKEKKEKEEWDKAKTTVSETKTATKTKPSKSTKA